VEQFHLVRGKRILQQLSEDSTVPALQSNIEKGFPGTTKRQHATGEVQLSNVEYIPYIGTKMLHVRCNATSNGHQYKQALQFMKVDFDNAETDENVAIQANDGTTAYAKPVALTNHNVKARCSCLDFYYRFANYNAQDKSLVGKPPLPYIKKTDRPPNNILAVPGLCKHLLKLTMQLQAIGLVV
jgi:hypothetical protein